MNDQKVNDALPCSCASFDLSGRHSVYCAGQYRDAVVTLLEDQRREIEGRLFPIADGPAIPWRIIAPYERQAFLNHGQTLERLASRGGLSSSEAVAVFLGKGWTRELVNGARERLVEIVAEKESGARLRNAETLIRDLVKAIESVQAAYWDGYYGKGITVEYARAVDAEIRDVLSRVKRGLEDSGKSA